MKKIIICFLTLLFISCFSFTNINGNKVKKTQIIKQLDTTRYPSNDTMNMDLDTVKIDDTAAKKNDKRVYKNVDNSKDIVEPNMVRNSNKVEKPNIKPNINKKHGSSKKSNDIEVKEGKLIYSIPDTMKLGNTYTINIRIKKDINNLKMIDSLYNQKIIDIKVTNSMEVEIIDPSPSDSKNFNILKQNSDKQIIDDSDYTEWVYYIQPLKSGKLQLNMIVSIIKDDNLKQIVYFNTTYVKSNPVIVVQTFWDKYWQWILSTIFFPFIIFIYRNIKNNEK